MCGLFRTKLLYDPIMAYCQLHPWENTVIIDIKIFSWNSKHSLEKWRKSVTTSMYWSIHWYKCTYLKHRQLGFLRDCISINDIGIIFNALSFKEAWCEVWLIRSLILNGNSMIMKKWPNTFINDAARLIYNTDKYGKWFCGWFIEISK